MTTAAPPARSGHQSLAFRVMRLCRPTFNASAAPLGLNPLDLLAGEDDDHSTSAAALPAADADDFSFRDRFLLSDSSQASTLSGQLASPSPSPPSTSARPSPPTSASTTAPSSRPAMSSSRRRSRRRSSGYSCSSQGGTTSLLSTMSRC